MVVTATERNTTCEKTYLNTSDFHVHNCSGLAGILDNQRKTNLELPVK